MFTVSMRLNKKKIAAFFVICLTVVSVIFLMTNSKKGEETTSKAAAAKESLDVSTDAGNNEDRLSFLAAFGWEVAGEPIETAEVRIPEEFDEVFTSYNEIQKLQGMNLEKLAGKRVKRYTYEILNHPSGEKNVHANLLVYKDKIIGGDICSVELDGFMHGFEMGETQTNTIIDDANKEVALPVEDVAEPETEEPVPEGDDTIEQEPEE